MAITMKGRKLDMSALVDANSHLPAIGNAGMNARGDRIDAKGVVIKTREQIDAETAAYHRENPDATRQAAISDLSKEIYQTPQEVYQRAAISAPIDVTAVVSTPEVITPSAPTNAKTRKISGSE